MDQRQSNSEGRQGEEEGEEAIRGGQEERRRGVENNPNPSTSSLFFRKLCAANLRSINKLKSG